MRDLKSGKLIVLKGLLFLIVAGATLALALAEAPSVRMAFLLITLVWSACRFYYFVFYALERYVDPTHRYASIRALAVELHRRIR